MSTALDPAPAPDVDRRKKAPLRGRRRILTVASVLLALVGGTVAQSAPAFAQPPTGACTQTCNNPPGGISPQDWNAALEAADFWANHRIDWQTNTWNQGNSYAWLTPAQNAGWPGQATGNRWFGYYETNQPNQHVQFIYYGGRFDDRDGLLSWRLPTNPVKGAGRFPCSAAITLVGLSPARIRNQSASGPVLPRSCQVTDTWQGGRGVGTPRPPSRRRLGQEPARRLL
ncbi:hypothetical protein [Streptomyces novaecaesareae]|uniref:hypothetical protein n=1 Tax=Streptomyces novaecaesareae TaxID=68244 RepID=UPI0012FEE52B|nr:hypothetical protein [Streptomyces novaecaesareae]